MKTKFIKVGFKKVGIKITYIFFLFFLFTEVFSFLSLNLLSNFLPKSLKEKFQIQKIKYWTNDPYILGGLCFNSKYGWNDFSCRACRLGILELLNIKKQNINNTANNGITDKFTENKRPLLITTGDSFTYAAEVSYYDSWPYQIEKFTGRKVVNLGTPGYGLDQAYLKAIDVGIPMNPEYMALCLDFAGIARNIARVNNFFDFTPGKPIFKPRFQISQNGFDLIKIPFNSKKDYNEYLSIQKIQKIAKFDGWYNFYNKYFSYDIINGWKWPYSINFYSFITSYSKAYSKNIPCNYNQILFDDNLDENKKAYHITYEIIKAFNKECKNASIKPLIIFLTPAPAKKLNKIANLCNELDVPIINIDHELRYLCNFAEISFKTAFFYGSGHFTVFANNMIAQYISSYILNLKNKSKNHKFKPDFSKALYNVYSSCILKSIPDILLSDSHNSGALIKEISDNKITPHEILEFIEEYYNLNIKNIHSSDASNYNQFKTNDILCELTLLKRFYNGIDLIHKINPDKSSSANRHLLIRACLKIPGWENAVINFYKNKDMKNYFSLATAPFNIKNSALKKSLKYYLQAHQNVTKGNIDKV